MRDKAHTEHLESWAEYVKTHPRSLWMKQLKPFLDSQIIIADRFYRRLAETKEGRKKIREIRGI